MFMAAPVEVVFPSSSDSAGDDGWASALTFACVALLGLGVLICAVIFCATGGANRQFSSCAHNTGQALVLDDPVDADGDNVGSSASDVARGGAARQRRPDGAQRQSQRD